VCSGRPPGVDGGLKKDPKCDGDERGCSYHYHADLQCNACYSDRSTRLWCRPPDAPDQSYETDHEPETCKDPGYSCPGYADGLVTASRRDIIVRRPIASGKNPEGSDQQYEYRRNYKC